MAIKVGLIGFGLFVMVLAIAGYQAMRQPKGDSRFWLTLLLVWVIGAAGLTWEQRKVTWLFLNLTVVGAGLSTRRDEETVTQLFAKDHQSKHSFSHRLQAR